MRIYALGKGRGEGRLSFIYRGDLANRNNELGVEFLSALSISGTKKMRKYYFNFAE